MGTQITTGKVRFSFVRVFRPEADENGVEKYGCTLLIPKTDKATVNKIKSAMAEAIEQYKKRNNGKSVPSNPKTTLHDGDGERPNGGEFGPECKGHWVITTNSKRKPVIVYSDKTPITEEGEFYSGCYGRAIINFYFYDKAGNKGITAGLNGVMKLHDGEPLSGGIVTDEDWDDGWQDEDTDDFDFLG